MFTSGGRLQRLTVSVLATDTQSGETLRRVFLALHDEMLRQAKG